MRVKAAVRFEPRKTPVQTRSAATVEVILQAAVQVLLREGQAKLTTTRIAARAGVSVGTLYQYFPNKSSVLQALLRVHLERIAFAVETAAASVHGACLAAMAEAVVSAFAAAKCRNLDASAALYAIADDLNSKQVAHDLYRRAEAAISGMLEKASGPKVRDPAAVAVVAFSAMAGVSRLMLTTRAEHRDDIAESMGRQLVVLVRAYFEASTDQTAP